MTYKSRIRFEEYNDYTERWETRDLEDLCTVGVTVYLDGKAMEVEDLIQYLIEELDKKEDMSVKETNPVYSEYEYFYERGEEV